MGEGACPPPPPPPPARSNPVAAMPSSAVGCKAGTRDALGGNGPQRRPQKRLGGRLEEVAEAVGGGYCRLQMPLEPALGVRETLAGRRLGALEGQGGG